MPLRNAGTSPDPLVARVDYALQIMIGENFIGQITAGSSDSGVLHTGLSSGSDRLHEEDCMA